MSRYLSWSFLAFALLLLVSAPVEAQVKPFKISGSGVAPTGLPLPGDPIPREHWIVGEATHLGRHHGAGSVLTYSADFSDIANNRITGTFGSGGPFTFVGANGDKLVCDYGYGALGEVTGQFELTIVGQEETGLVVVAKFIAEFVPRGAECTGKFKNVSGSWTMYAETEPFVLASSDPLYYSWEGNGKLKFAK